MKGEKKKKEQEKRKVNVFALKNYTVIMQMTIHVVYLEMRYKRIN